MEDALYDSQYTRPAKRKIDYRQKEDQIEPEKKQRIKLWMGACLVMVAIFIDILQFLLTGVVIGVIISSIITVGASFLFWLWLNTLGVSYISNPKRLATFAIGSLGELIPAINVIPLWTVGMILTIIVTRSEDKGGIIGKAANIAPLPKK